MSRKYFFNEHYFDEIDTKEKAYWLGFMYADGCIYKNTIISCYLKNADTEHLIQFLKEIEMSEIYLSHSEKTNSDRFTLTSKIMHDRLVELGFSNNKSYDNTPHPFDIIPDMFKKYFILGFWDGDGSFSIGNNHRNLASVISNNKLLLESISEYINNSLGDNFSKVKYKTNGDPYFRIRFSRNKAKLFGDWLYNDAPPCFLQRKYNKYLQMKIGTKAHTGFDNGLVKGILCIESNQVYATAKECSMGEFGVDNPGSCNNIRACCRGDRNQTRGKHFRYLTEKERRIYNDKFNF